VCVFCVCCFFSQTHVAPLSVMVDGGGSGERRDGMVTMCDIGDVSTAVA
jgi:hypothetical protein